MNLSKIKPKMILYQTIEDEYLEVLAKYPFDGLEFNPQYESVGQFAIAGLFIEVSRNIATVSIGGRFLITNIPIKDGIFTLTNSKNQIQTFVVDELPPIRANWNR